MKTYLLCAASVAGLLASPCMAQTTTAPEPDAQPAARQEQAAAGDEIVVTAGLRAETLQDTPAAVSVATAEMLAEAGVTSALDLPRALPGVVIERAPAALNASVTLRGLGSSGAPGTFESSVGFFINGAYLPRSREFSAALFDVERIEVVRGSQGSVLGKNVSLGAVNLTTRRPGKSFEANAELTHEFNYDSWTVNAGLSVPLSDTLAIRFAGIYDRQGGWVENVVTGDMGGEATRKAGRATLVWSPSSSFDATLIYDHQEVRLSGLAAEIAQPNAAVIGLAALGGVPNLETNLDQRSADSDSRIPNGYLDTDNTDRLLLTAKWQIGGYELMSQTAWSNSTGDSDAGADYLPGDYFRYTLGLNTSALSEELRLTSSSDVAVRHVLGAWIGRNTYKQFDQWDLNYPPPLGATKFVNYVDQSTTSWSLFGQADVDIVDRLTLTGGARYTNERKEVDFERVVLTPGLFTAAFPAYAPFTLKRHETALDGLASLRYAISDDLMAYVSWAQGTKSGGFASVVGLLDQSQYDPEVAQTTELGVRYQNPDRSLTINATLFSTKVDGYQLTTFNGATFVVANTDLKSKGVETQVIWRPAFAQGLRFDWNNTYAKAEDAITGARIPNAPRWSGGASASFERAVNDDLSLNLRVGVQYESSQTRQQAPDFPPPSDAIAKLDAAIGLELDNRFTAKLVGRNITNANRTVFAFPTAFVGPGSYVAVSERPRTISLELAYRY